MLNWVRRIGQIYEGEGYKVLWFSLLGVLLQAGIGIGYVSADSMFISYLGVETLPYVFFTLPFVMIVVTPIISLITQRFSALSMQLMALLVLSGGGIWLYFLNDLALAEGDEYLWIFFGIKVYSVICYITAYTIYWNFVDTYFDILSAKRLFPLLGASNALGSLLGGYLVILCMSQSIPVGYLFLIWGGISFLALFPTGRLYSFKPLVHFDHTEEASLVEQIGTLQKSFLKSRYAVMLALCSFFVMTIAPLCEFQYMQVFEEVYPDEQQLASLLGMLFMVVNVFNFVVVLFLFNRLVVGLGVRNVAVIQPLIYLITFIGFITVFGTDDLMFWMAVFGFFAFQGFHTSIEFNNFNLIINPIPRESKASIRTLIEGWAEPFGSAVAGLILIFATEVYAFSSLGVALLATGLCLIYLTAILILRSDFTTATINNLRSEWLDFSRNEEEIHAGCSEEEMERLLEWVKSDNHFESIAACRIIWHNDHNRAVIALLEQWEKASLKNKQAYSRLLGEMFADKDNDVNRLILDWLIMQDEESRHTFVRMLNQHTLVSATTLIEMVNSEDTATRASASGLLWQHWDAENSLMAVQTFHDLMNGKEAERKAAIELLANTSESRFAQYLQTFKKEKNPELRRAANIALASLVNAQHRNLVGDVIQLLGDDDPEVQLAVFNAIERIGDSNGIPPLLEQADVFSPYQRRLAQQAVLHIGLKCVPTCMRVLKDERFPYAGRSIAARALAQMAFPQMEAALPELIEREIHHAYQMVTIYHTVSSNTFSSNGFECLTMFYRDEQFRSISFVLELLSFGGRIANHEMILAALSSVNPATRGNAIETLEQSVNRSFYKLLLPLVDGRSAVEQVHSYQRRFHSKAPSVYSIIENAWSSLNPLEKSIAAQAKLESAIESAGGDASHESLKSALDILGADLSGAHPRVRDVILSLIRKLDGLTPDTLIDRLVSCKHTDLFGSIVLGELVTIADDAEFVSCSEGESLFSKGDDADSVFVVESGSLECRNGSVHAKAAGAVVGYEALQPNAKRSTDVVTTSAVTGYRIARDTMEDAARLYPRLAMKWVQIQAGEVHDEA